MDPKSDLQIKILGLKRGYTAKDIKYVCTHAKRSKWRATLKISNVIFKATSAFNSKAQAEAAAAQSVLDSWPKVKKMLKKKKHTKRPKKMPWNYVSDDDDEEEDDEERWNSAEEEFKPTKEQFEMAGRYLYAAIRTLEEKKI